MRRALFVVVLLAILLSGCVNETSDTFSNTGTEYENIIETSAQEAASVASESEEVNESPRTQESIDAAWLARLNYNGSGLDNIPSIVSNNYIPDDFRAFVVSVEDDDYAELNDSIWQAQMSLLETLDFESQDTVIVSFGSNIYRCDNRLLSMMTHYYSFQMESEDVGERSYVCQYRTWDYNGQDLLLTDVINDYSYFIATVSPLIEDAFRDFDEISTDELIDSMLHNTNPEEVEYYMTAYSMYFACPYSGVSSDEDEINRNKVWIQVDYEEYADLFNPEYLPGDGLMISGFIDDVDGLTNRINLERYDSEYNHPTGNAYLVLNCNGEDYLLTIYGSEEAAIAGEAGGSYDVPGFLIVLFDSDTGEEIGSQAVDTLLGFDVRIADYSVILQFVGEYADA